MIVIVVWVCVCGCVHARAHASESARARFNYFFFLRGPVLMQAQIIWEKRQTRSMQRGNTGAIIKGKRLTVVQLMR